MTEPITARQFHLSSGVGDWRVADGGACAYFPTGSFATGTRFVQAVAELPDLDDHAPDVDLRPDGVFVRLFTTAPAPDRLSSRDVEMARRISSAAQQLGLTAEPSEVQNVVVTIDALDISRVLPFWRAVLGYGDRDGGPVEELNDRHRRKPVVSFQQMGCSTSPAQPHPSGCLGAPRPGRGTGRGRSGRRWPCRQRRDGSVGVGAGRSRGQRGLRRHLDRHRWPRLPIAAS
jgi:4a-hydroxytetrahydrobiopterin dehydratase